MPMSKARRKAPTPKLRVKIEPPSLEEAMVAAACISDDASQQLEIAASLMGLPLDDTSIKALAAARPRGNVIDISGRDGMQRAVVVEKKRVVRPLARPTVGAARQVTGQLRLNRAV